MSFRVLASNASRPRRSIALALAVAALSGLPGCGDDSNQRTSLTWSEEYGEPLAPDATLEQALAHRDPLQRVQRVAQILEQTPPGELERIQAIIERAPLNWGDLEYALFASWWARFDPESALAYCEDELRMNHPRVVSEVLRTWARTDPDTVLESGWLDGRSMDGQVLNLDYIDPLVVGWFEGDQPGLEAWIQYLDPSSKSTALAAYMRMKMMKDGARPALEWTQTAPYSPDMQRLLLATGLNVVARQEPQLAIEWLDIAKERGLDVRTFVARISRGWATHDPRAALEWLMGQDVEPIERWRAAEGIARLWLIQDEPGMRTWLASHGQEAWVDVIRRQAIVAHVKRNRYEVDWESVMEDASRFVTEDLRARMYLWIVQRWKMLEPDGAEKWLAKNAKLLGDMQPFVDQVPAGERKKIEAMIAADRADTAAEG